MSETFATTSGGGRKGTILVQLLIIVALCFVLLRAVSAADAAKGDLVIRLEFLGRMVVLVVLATIFLSSRKLGWRDVGLKRPTWWRFFLAIPLGFVAIVVLNQAARMALAQLGLNARPDYSMLSRIPGNLSEYLFWLLPVSWGSAAFGEEFVFRGFVQDALARLMGFTRLAVFAAIVVQAVIFGALHLYLGLAGAVIAGVTGLALGLVWWASGRNLWAPIVLHGLVDSSTMTAAYLGAFPAG